MTPISKSRNEYFSTSRRFNSRASSVVPTVLYWYEYEHSDNGTGTSRDFSSAHSTGPISGSPRPTVPYS
eukprot:scaffold556374_cov19-Prasinocladus_malaysianus.AAC.1